MKSTLLIGFLSLALVHCRNSGEMPAQNEPSSEEESSTADNDWVVLFDGQDLSNFNQVGGANWNVVDNVIEATSGEAGFLVTKEAYGDVEVELEFWTSPEANSGIYMRCQNPAELSASSCYEVNIFDQRPDPTYRTGAIVGVSEPMVQMDAADRWNTFDIVMQGNHLMVTMNDKLTVDAQDDKHAKGPIGLQWAAGTVKFRNIRVKPL